MGVLGFDNFLRLRNQDGTEAVFELLDMIEYKDDYYIVLLPDGDDEKEIKILQIEVLPDDREAYVSLRDEATGQAVFQIFMDRNRHLFDFNQPE